MQYTEQTSRTLIQPEPFGFTASYLRFYAAHLADLEELIVAQDLDSVSRVAARLSWNANHLGLNELSSLGRQLAEYCIGADWEAITDLFDAIESTVRRLCTSTPREIHAVFEAPRAPFEIEIKRAD